MKISKPESPWLGEVVPSVLAALGAWQGAVPIELPKASSAIIIMVDGLGLELLESYRAHASTLRRFLPETRRLSTCLPSTTAAALTSFSTGALPGQTRMVGYSVLQDGGVMNLLHFNDQVDPSAWQPVPTYFSELEGGPIRPYVVTTPRFVGSGLTRAAFRGAEFIGRETLRERFEFARDLARNPGNLIYLYWSEIDHAGHQEGPGSDRWLHELEEFDRELGLFLRGAPTNSLVVLTADHGMVEVDERVELSESQLAEGVDAIAGEGRAVHVHAKRGAAPAVLERWSDILADRAVLVPRADFPQVFGPGPGNDLMGDMVAFALGGTVVVDSLTQSSAAVGQRGVHGSITEQEISVPLMLLKSP